MCTVVNVIFQKEREEKREGRVTYIKKKHRGRNLRLKSVPFCCSGIWEDLVAQERAVSNFGQISGQCQILGTFWGTFWGGS